MATTKMPGQQVTPTHTTKNNSGRIKYADPRSLPSFPSAGLAPDGAAASAAASLGWSNHKSPEFWKPDPSSSASAAAVLAKDYKMSPAWEPSPQSAGHKAALLAVGSAGAALKKSNTVGAKTSPPAKDTWGSSAANQAFAANRPPSAEPVSLAGGSSAATQAFRENRSQSMKKVERPRTPPGDRSLVAAKGAMNRPLSSSSTGFKDAHAAETSAASNALNGATLAHRQSMKAKPKIEDVGAVSVTTMTRNMFTANPPVKPEVDERTYNEKIHQSAVEMAKKMYATQQKMVDQTKEAHAQNTESTAGGHQYVNLQDAAYKQAQARLAKLHDEHQQSREYQEYYGSTSDKSPKRRFSMGKKLRRRSWDSDDDMDDRQRSEKIKEQMSMFSTQLSQVDKGKRDKDREALLAAAQRNVKAQLHGMDEKVYNETGRANPSLITDWEAKAQKAAQARVDSGNVNKGKIDIGGGRFMTQEEIDAIARSRIQPVLDDINDKAETERERQAVLKLEEEARREEADKQKVRDREIKEINRKAKEDERQEQKAKRVQEKLEEKAKKDEEKVKRQEEKAAMVEQKRQAKEEKRKSKVGGAAAVATQGEHEPTDEAAQGVDETSQGAEVTETTESAVEASEPAARESETRGEAAQDLNLGHERPTVETNIESTGSAQRKAEGSTSPGSKVKGWIKNRFSRGKSFSEQGEKSEKGDKRRSFFGGASMKSAARNDSTTSIENRSTSMHDVALAGKGGEESHAEGKSSSRGHQHDDDQDSHGISPISTPLEEERELGADKVHEADILHNDVDDDDHDITKDELAPPLAIEDPVVRTSSSPTRDSRFREELPDKQ